MIKSSQEDINFTWYALSWRLILTLLLLLLLAKSSLIFSAGVLTQSESAIIDSSDFVGQKTSFGD